jgi:rhodanese-related sulfurtransferase
MGGGGVDAPLVIDVRQPSEFEAGHVPGSVAIGAGDLSDRLDQLPRDRPIATICASGYRSSVAASLLRAAGFERVSWVPGGVPTWGARGLPLAYGPEGSAAERPGVLGESREPSTPDSPVPGASGGLGESDGSGGLGESGEASPPDPSVPAAPAR